jgi:2-polyprenyl-3-methyl-5-hydroxy-6-metoxy-1,4-benzoquinol methylase
MVLRMEPREHWERTYTRRRPTQVGWYEPDPAVSRRLVMAAVAQGAESVIDVGGGASFLVDQLLELGVGRVAVMDISEAGIDVARQRLGRRASMVEWIVADVTARQDVGGFDVWHDRAVFHFLLDPDLRHGYVGLSERTVTPGGTAIMATFSHDGPERCSGLPVHRYEPDELARECGPMWLLSDSERYVHTTPGGVEQSFAYTTFRRVKPTS